MSKTAIAMNAPKTNECPEDCMCSKCVDLSDRPTLTPGTIDDDQRPTEVYLPVPDPIEPTDDVRSDSNPTKQLQSSAVDDALQRMPTMPNELQIADLDSPPSRFDIFEGYGEWDDDLILDHFDSLEDRNDVHEQGCRCIDCAEFFDRLGCDNINDIDPFTSEEHTHMFLWGAYYEDHEELLRALKDFLLELQGNEVEPLTWLIRKVKREIQFLTQSVRIEMHRKNHKTRLEIRAKRSTCRQQEDETRRNNGRLKRRVSKGRSEWIAKPRKMEKRRARQQYAQKAA